MKKQTEHLKPSHLASLLGVTTETIHAWRKRGWILHVKTPTGQYLIPASEYQRLKKDHLEGIR